MGVAGHQAGQDDLLLPLLSRALPLRLGHTQVSPMSPADDSYLQFVSRIRRKTLYYMYNIVFPCMMMSTLTVLVFCMPPDSGEKIALGVTVILAFSVFMLAIAERMPETSESIPLIGNYFKLNFKK